MLKWRLKKHAKMHTRQFVQSCQYFNNGNKCPYEKLGCKFLNVVTEMCKYGKKCHKRLCPQRHDEQKVNTDNLTSLGDEHCNENEEKNDSDASFVTSTPQKTVFQCEECEENRHLQHNHQLCHWDLPEGLILKVYQENLNLATFV